MPCYCGEARRGLGRTRSEGALSGVTDYRGHSRPLIGHSEAHLASDWLKKVSQRLSTGHRQGELEGGRNSFGNRM